MGQIDTQDPMLEAFARAKARTAAPTTTGPSDPMLAAFARARQQTQPELRGLSGYRDDIGGRPGGPPAIAQPTSDALNVALGVPQQPQGNPQDFFGAAPAPIPTYQNGPPKPFANPGDLGEGQARTSLHRPDSLIAALEQSRAERAASQQAGFLGRTVGATQTALAGGLASATANIDRLAQQQPISMRPQLPLTSEQVADQMFGVTPEHKQIAQHAGPVENVIAQAVAMPTAFLDPIAIGPMLAAGSVGKVVDKALQAEIEQAAALRLGETGIAMTDAAAQATTRPARSLIARTLADVAAKNPKAGTMLSGALHGSTGMGTFSGMHAAISYPDWATNPEGGIQAVKDAIGHGAIAGAGYGLAGAALGLPGQIRDERNAKALEDAKTAQQDAATAFARGKQQGQWAERENPAATEPYRTSPTTPPEPLPTEPAPTATEQPQAPAAQPTPEQPANPRPIAHAIKTADGRVLTGENLKAHFQVADKHGIAYDDVADSGWIMPDGSYESNGGFYKPKPETQKFYNDQTNPPAPAQRIPLRYRESGLPESQPYTPPARPWEDQGPPRPPRSAEEARAYIAQKRQAARDKVAEQGRRAKPAPAERPQDGRKEEIIPVGDDFGDPPPVLTYDHSAPEEVISPAIRGDSGKIYAGIIHGDIANNMPEGDLNYDVPEDVFKARVGFITNHGRFMTREEAGKWAGIKGDASEAQIHDIDEAWRKNNPKKTGASNVPQPEEVRQEVQGQARTPAPDPQRDDRAGDAGQQPAAAQAARPLPAQEPEIPPKRVLNQQQPTGKPLTRQSIEKTLMERHEAIAGPQEPNENAGTGGATRAFYKRIPTELSERMTKKELDAAGVQVVDHRNQSGGEDYVHEDVNKGGHGGDWDSYVRELKGDASGPKVAAAKKFFADFKDDPEAAFLTALHDQIPKGGKLKNIQQVKAKLLKAGDTFTVNGIDVRVEDAGDGSHSYLVLKDGDELPETPLEALSTVPMDKGSMGKGEDATPKVASATPDVAPAKPPTNTSEAKATIAAKREAPKPTEAPAAPEKPIPKKTRAQLIDEFHKAFDHVPFMERSTTIALADQLQRASGEGKDEWWSKRFAEFTDRPLKKGEDALHQDSAAHAPQWYSKLRQTVEAKMGGSMDANALRAMLTNAGVKPEEMEWSRVGDLTGKVSKRQVLDHLDENAVKVEEVSKGNPNQTKLLAEKERASRKRQESTRALRNAIAESSNHQTAEEWINRIVSGGREPIEMREMIQQVPEVRDALARFKADDKAFHDAENARIAQQRAGSTKFQQYQLPGGENYRELLLTMPDRTVQPRTQDNFSTYAQAHGYTTLDQVNRAWRNEQDPIYRQWNADRFPDQTRGQNFTASHWDEPNVLAHIRFNTREIGGKKVLFIEEIQSDWHQKGREQGYANPNARLYDVKMGDNILANGFESKDAAQAWIDGPDGSFYRDHEQRAGRSVQIVEGAKNEAAAIGVPNAPFKKNWHELAMKRVIRYAAENGYDKVAWTPGDIQNERYDLSKQVDSIDVGKNSGDSYFFSAQKGGRELTAKGNLTAVELADHIGKDLTKKALEDLGDSSKPGPSTPKTYSGLDLKVGGSGMRGFYDDILPKSTDKIIKKWGGKTSLMDIPYGDAAEGNTQMMTGFDITPNMREEVLSKGQPLFQGGKRGAVQFLEDGRAIVHAFEGADVSTAWHEIGHVLRRNLPPEEQAIVDAHFGIKPGEKWTREHEEAYSEAWENYGKTGKAPTPELQPLFDKMREWLVGLYTRIKSGLLGKQMDPVMSAHFDRMLTPKNEREAKAALEAKKAAAAEPPPKAEEPPAPEAKPEPIPEAKPTAEPDSNAIGMNKAEQDRFRKETGLSELPDHERRGWEEVLETAKREGHADRALDTAAASLKSGEGLTDVEHAGAVLKAAELANRYDDAIERIAKLTEAGADAGTIKSARALADTIMEQIDLLTDATRKSRRETARALGIGRMMVNRESFQLADVVQRATKAKGEKLAPDQHATLESLTKIHKEEVARLEAETRKAVERAETAEADRHHEQLLRQAAEKDIPPAVREVADRFLKTLGKAADGARARIKARGIRLHAGIDPIEMADYAIIGAEKLARGLSAFAEWSGHMIAEIGEWARPHLNDIWDASQRQFEDEAAKLAGPARGFIRRKAREQTPAETVRRMRSRVVDGAKPQDLQPYLQKIAIGLIREGITDREKLLDALHKTVKAAMPPGRDISRTQVRDILSGYGNFKPLDMDAAKARLREVKGESQKLAQLEALTAGQPPKATGVQRQAPSDEARRLTKLVNEAKKAAGLTQSGPRDLKTVLDTTKTRLKNQINDLQTQIDTGLKDAPRGKPAAITDPEIDALKKHLDTLKQAFDEAFPNTNRPKAPTPPRTDAQKLATATKAAKAIAESWERRLSDAKAGKFDDAAKPTPMHGPELDALRARATAAREAYNELKSLDPVQKATAEAKENAAYRAMLAAKEAELLERIATGDVAPRTKPTGKAKDALSLKAKERVADLQTQARLLHQIEQAENGVLSTKPKGAGTASAEVKLLRSRLSELRAIAYKTIAEADRLERADKKIAELQDLLDKHARPARKARAETPPDLAALRQKAAEIRTMMRVEDTLTDLNHQIETGDFKVTARPFVEPTPELERAQLAVRKARQNIRRAIEDLRPKTAGQKIDAGLNFLRTSKATADVSYALRQGAMLSARRPGAATTAFVKSLQAALSEHTAEQIDNAIRTHPNQYLRDRAGLYLAELGDGTGSVKPREEAFMSNAAENIPGWGRVVKGSERNMVTGLNLLRVAAFDGFLEAHPNATRAELEAWADYVNKASGRGDLGQSAGAARLLSSVFFAPRFAVSRFQTPWTVVKYWKMPRVRNEIAKDMAAFYGTGIAALTLAGLAGASVGTDPRDPDFGKVRFGDTRVDLWGGEVQAFRLLANMATNGYDRIKLAATDGKDMTNAERAGIENYDPLDAAGRFARYKLAPSITMPHDLITGKDVTGQDTSRLKTAATAVLPMLWTDVYDAYHAYEGTGAKVGAAAGTLIGGGMGLGVSTYPDSEAAIRREYLRIRKEGNKAGAESLRLKWNRDHPENQISPNFTGEPTKKK